MDNVLSVWKGRSIAEYIGEKGLPTAVVAVDRNTKFYQWVITGQSAAFAVPIGGIIVAEPSQTFVCRISFTAETKKTVPSLADWIITGFQWTGAC